MICRSIFHLVHRQVHVLFCLAVHLITEVGARSIAKFSITLFCTVHIKTAFAPQFCREERKVIETVVNIILADTVVQVVCHIIPYCKCSSDHLLVSGRDRHTADGIDRQIVHRAVAEIIIIVSCIRNDIIISVITVDQVKTVLIHLIHVRISEVPEVDLNAFRVDLFSLCSLGKASPYTGFPSGAFHIVDHVVYKCAVCLRRCIVLVSTDMYDRILIEYAFIQILSKDRLYERKALVIRINQVQMVVLTSACSVSQLRKYLCQRQ